MGQDHERKTMNGSKDMVKHNGHRLKVDEKENLGHDYEEILDVIGFGRVQVKMVIVCAMVLLMIMNELMGISIITIASQCEFDLNDADRGIMHGVVLWGKIASSYFLGYLSDKFGRRSVLIYTNLAGVSCSFATMFVSNYTIFIILRFGIGFWTGGAVGIILAYVAEFCAAVHRPILMNFSNAANGVSFIYVPVAAWLILLMDWKLVVFKSFVFRPWRLLIFFNLLPGLIASIMLLSCPESPKFLQALGRHKEAYDALDWVCQKNRKGQKLSELNVYKINELNDGDRNLECNEKAGVCDEVGNMCMEALALFKPPHLLNFLASSLAMSGAFIISFGLAVWYPDIQNMMGSHKTDLQVTVCEVIVDANRVNSTTEICNDHVTSKSLFDFTVYGAISIIAYIILGAVISPRRRKALLMFLLTTAGLCGTALIWLKNPTLIVIVFSFYLVLADLGVSTILGFLVDLLPTKLCGQGSCLVMTTARISGAVSTYFIGLHLSTHCVFVFEIFALMMLVCAVLAYFLNPRCGAKVKDSVP